MNFRQQQLIEQPFQPKHLPIHEGSKTITRKFALIPDTYYKRQEYKKITERMIKFRELENIYVQILVRALDQGQLTLQDFVRTSNAAIKKNIYDKLQLTNVRTNQFKNLELKERMRRCATQHPFHAVRNWLVRNNNLFQVVNFLENAFISEDGLIISFLLGKGLPRAVLKMIFTALKQDVFGQRQNLSYFLIDNMVGQLRNIFLENTSLENVLKARLQQIGEENFILHDCLKHCLSDFFYKKKSNTFQLGVAELPLYFLNRYFTSLKSRDTRRVKKKMEPIAFKNHKKNRDVSLERSKEIISREIIDFKEIDVWNAISNVFHEVLKVYSSGTNIILTKHVFKPSFTRSPITTPDIQGFNDFFRNILKNKIKERFKTLFLVPSVINVLLADLKTIGQNIGTFVKIPETKKLSVPIIAREQVFKDEYRNLKVSLSFVEREFINFKIQDKKGRIASFLGVGAIAKVPVITFKRRKLILNLPFEVTKKEISKQSQASHDQKKKIEVGVDLGLKHFAVLSVMDDTVKNNPKELGRYFIGSKQLFDMKLDSLSGKVGKRNNHASRNASNVKLKLVHLRENIKDVQRRKNEVENRYIARGENPKEKLKFSKLSETLSMLWERTYNINLEIVRQLNHLIIAIARYHGASKIKMEDLKFSKHAKKRARGNYLAFWQTHWLFGQIEEAIELQAWLNHINFERVDAAYTSQKCSECGSKKHANRDGKQFTCKNASKHENRKIFHLDADLNAARNIALA